jgi:hypothetical protein
MECRFGANVMEKVMSTKVNEKILCQDCPMENGAKQFRDINLVLIQEEEKRRFRH